jgi:hypothetical protein
VGEFVPAPRMPVGSGPFLHALQSDTILSSALEPLASSQLQALEGLSSSRRRGWEECRDALSGVLNLGLPLTQGSSSRMGFSGYMQGGSGANTTLQAPPQFLPPSGGALEDSVLLLAQSSWDPVAGQRVGGGPCRLLGRAVTEIHRKEESGVGGAIGSRYTHIWKVASGVTGEAHFQGEPPHIGHGAEEWGCLPHDSTSTSLSADLFEFRPPLERVQRGWATAALNLVASQFFSTPTFQGGSVGLGGAPTSSLSKVQSFLLTVRCGHGNNGICPPWFVSACRLSVGQGEARGPYPDTPLPFFPQLYLLLRVGAWEEALSLLDSHGAGGATLTSGERTVCGVGSEVLSDIRLALGAVVSYLQCASDMGGYEGPGIAPFSSMGTTKAFPGAILGCLQGGYGGGGLGSVGGLGMGGGTQASFSSGLGGTSSLGRVGKGSEVRKAMQNLGSLWCSLQRNNSLGGTGKDEVDPYFAAIVCFLGGPWGEPRVSCTGGSQGKVLAPVIATARDWVFHRLWFSALSPLFTSIAQESGGGGSSISASVNPPPHRYTLWDLGGEFLREGEAMGCTLRPYEYSELLLLCGQPEAAVAVLLARGGEECPSLHLTDATHLALGLSWHGFLRTFPLRWSAALSSLPAKNGSKGGAEKLTPVSGHGGLLFECPSFSSAGATPVESFRGIVATSQSTMVTKHAPPSQRATPLYVLDVYLLIETYLLRTWPFHLPSQNLTARVSAQEPSRTMSCASTASFWLNYFSLLPNAEARVAQMGTALVEVSLSEGMEDELAGLLTHVTALCGPPTSPRSHLLSGSLFATAAEGCSGQSGPWVSSPARLWLAAAEASAEAVGVAESGEGGNVDGATMASEYLASFFAVLNPSLAASADLLHRLVDSQPPGIPAAAAERERSRLQSLAGKALDLLGTLSGRFGNAFHPLSQAMTGASAAKALLHVSLAFDIRSKFGGNLESLDPWKTIIGHIDASGLLPYHTTSIPDLPKLWSRLVGSLPHDCRRVYTPLLHLTAETLIRLFHGSGGRGTPGGRECQVRMEVLAGASPNSGGPLSAAIDSALYTQIIAAASKMA